MTPQETQMTSSRKQKAQITDLTVIEGLGPGYKERLINAGIYSVEDLLQKGATHSGRRNIVDASGMSAALVLKFVNHADLFRVKGVGGQYAELLAAAGVNSVPELAKRNATSLTVRMGKVNSQRNIVGALPSKKVVSGWVVEAKTLPRILKDMRQTAERMVTMAKAGSTPLTVSTGHLDFEFEMPRHVPTDTVVAGIERMMELLEKRKAALSEDNITNLVDIVLNDNERASVELDLEMDNAELRAAYLKTEKLLNSTQVRQLSGLSPKNKSEPASRWRRERKLFSIAHKGLELFPAFQFKDGQPNPVIKKILNELPDDYSAWQIAFWFASGNGWLEGEAPQKRLGAEKDVIEAAQRAAQETVG